MRYLYVILGLFLLSAMAQVQVTQPAIAPSACAWPPNVNTGVAECPTTDPVSPLYVALNGGKFQPATQAPALSSFACTSVTGTMTLAANGVVTITNATGAGCTFK